MLTAQKSRNYLVYFGIRGIALRNNRAIPEQCSCSKIVESCTAVNISP